jgi:outer membrane protein assembly factor BamB
LILLTSCGGGLPSASWFGIAANEETVYLAANDQVIALDLDDGTELWSFPPEKGSGPFFTPPLLTDDRLLVGGFGDGVLYAISQDDGDQEWSVETEGKIVEGAAAVDGGIVVGNGEGTVYLVETETLEKQTLVVAEESIWASPLVDRVNNRVYVASMDHHLYAVDLESGDQLWIFEANGALAGTPALSDGMLYFGTLNSTFYAIDAETGAELWSIETEGWVWGGPLVDSNTVYFGDMAGKLYALDAADGSERWPAFEAEGGVRVTPVLADGLLYFGTRQKKVYAIRAEDGRQERVQSLNGAIYSQPVIQGGFLLVSPHNSKAKLVALDTEGLAERWAYPRREE